MPKQKSTVSLLTVSKYCTLRNIFSLALGGYLIRQATSFILSMEVKKMASYVLIGFLIIVCIWDIKTYEIPPVLVIIGSLLGLITQFIGNGWHGILSALLAYIIVLIITFGIWAIGESLFGSSIIGAGDMKLLMIVSIFVGVKLTFIIFYWSILVAAFLFIFMIQPKEILGLFRHIFHFFVYAIPKPKMSTKKLAFSVPITLATAYFILF